MHAQENAETAGLRRCQACDREQRTRDKFCRQCGIRQHADTTSAANNADWSVCKTGPLPVATRYDSFSGALVSLVAGSVSARASALSANRWSKRLASALVAIPLWFMILMLSPLDAYVAARAITKRV